MRREGQGGKDILIYHLASLAPFLIPHFAYDAFQEAMDSTTATCWQLYFTFAKQTPKHTYELGCKFIVTL